jgi:hypothetical protein
MTIHIIFYRLIIYIDRHILWCTHFLLYYKYIWLMLKLHFCSIISTYKSDITIVYSFFNFILTMLNLLNYAFPV